MSQEKRMIGKRVLVTGAGTGIGKGVACEFARQGADVVLHYSHSKEGALRAVEEAREMGVRAEAFKTDFSSVEEVKELGRKTLEFLGGIDVLVNNAGITMNMPFEQVTVDQFDLLYQVNVRAQFFLTQSVLPAMSASGGGAVINMTSIHALEGFPEHSVYAGTKGAIIAYTRQLAIELAPKGIRVNAIAPGAVLVDNHFKVMRGFDPDEMGKLIPLGFMGKPSDVAGVAVFLASDDARYITGQTLVVDGGTTSWMPFSDEFRKPFDACFGKGYVPGI